MLTKRDLITFTDPGGGPFSSESDNGVGSAFREEKKPIPYYYCNRRDVWKINGRQWWVVILSAAMVCGITDWYAVYEWDVSR